MQTAKKEMSEEMFLDEIYKNAKMGVDSILHLLPAVKDDTFRSVLTAQLDGYERFASRAAEALAVRGIRAKEENLMVRGFARVGMTFNTLLDSTSTHLAEIMIEGSNMGITDMTRLLNHFEPAEEGDEAVRLAREVVDFETRNLEILKPYL